MSCLDVVVAMERMAQHLALKSRALGNDFVAICRRRWPRLLTSRAG
jgi:hypothetical protein